MRSDDGYFVRAFTSWVETNESGPVEFAWLRTRRSAFL